MTRKGPSPGKLRALPSFAIVSGDSGRTSSSRPFFSGLEQVTSSVTGMETPPRPHRRSIRGSELGPKSRGVFHTQPFGAKGRCPSSVASRAALRRRAPLEPQRTWARGHIVFLSPADCLYQGRHAAVLVHDHCHRSVTAWRAVLGRSLRLHLGSDKERAAIGERCLLRAERAGGHQEVPTLRPPCWRFNAAWNHHLLCPSPGVSSPC